MPSEACQLKLIKEGIRDTDKLLKEKNKQLEIIYLADRWFDNCKIMKYIEELGGTYCIRIKSRLTFYIHNYGEIAGYTKDVKPKEKEEQYFERVTIIKHRYDTKMAVSKKEGHEEAIYVLTNGKVEEGIKNYSYRFGSIECIFKNQKSNGFRLESTKMKNIQSFKTMFGIMCVALVWLIILGVEYTVKKEKNKIKIKIYKKKDKGKRIISLFNTGLMYFNLCLNSYQVPKIRCNFLLYEI